MPFSVAQRYENQTNRGIWWLKKTITIIMLADICTMNFSGVQNYMLSQATAQLTFLWLTQYLNLLSTVFPPTSPTWMLSFSPTPPSNPAQLCASMTLDWHSMFWLQSSCIKSAKGNQAEHSFGLYAQKMGAEFQIISGFCILNSLLT
jgi:hypothetical protein